MAEQAEQVSPASVATVTPKVTDEALDAAYQQAQGKDVQEKIAEVKEEVQEVKEAVQEQQQAADEPKKDEDKTEWDKLSQFEKTGVGRRMKKIEEAMDTILQRLETPVVPQRNAQEAFVPKVQAPDIIATKEDVWAAQDEREEIKAREITEKEIAYSRMIAGFAKHDASVYKEVTDEMFKNFNKIVHPDPRVCATLNYLSAKTAVLERKATPSKPNLKLKGDTQVSTDLSVESKSDQTQDSPVKLSEAAADFINRTGMKPDSVKKALSGEMPFYLGKPQRFK